jgi:hypothetical protein
MLLFQDGANSCGKPGEDFSLPVNSLLERLDRFSLLVNGNLEGFLSLLYYCNCLKYFVYVVHKFVNIIPLPSPNFQWETIVINAQHDH